MQCAVNTTTEEEVFSMWFAYIQCGATDVFSMDPPQDYKSGKEPNQIRTRERVTEREREWSEPMAVKEEGFG
jgi:hypothetical protein